MYTFLVNLKLTVQRLSLLYQFIFFLYSIQSEPQTIRAITSAQLTLESIRRSHLIYQIVRLHVIDNLQLYLPTVNLRSASLRVSHRLFFVLQEIYWEKKLIVH